MNDRSETRARFLRSSGYGDADVIPLAGDASNRRYFRLVDPASERRHILMDAPPENGQDTVPFVRIAKHLRRLGLSAPEIFDVDNDAGLIVLEDLGDDLFARVINRNGALEPTLYKAAVDVLISLRTARAPEVFVTGPEWLADMTMIAFSKYAAAGRREISVAESSEFKTRFTRILGRSLVGTQVLALRDYHAENLIWMPDRTDRARTGLLDFQDAFLCHPAYDLVSLLRDARRDVPPEIETEMIQYYLSQTGDDAEAFATAYAVLGVQRNLRILGVFGRLGTDFEKPHYVDLIPRVWTHVMRGLDHSELEPVAAMLRDCLPDPTPENLAKLKPI